MITFLIYLGSTIIACAVVSIFYSKKMDNLSKKYDKLVNDYDEAVITCSYIKRAYERKCKEVIDMKERVTYGNNSQIVKKLMERINIAERKLMENGLL